MRESVLAQVRREGYQDGYESGKQLRAAAYDDAHYKGWLEAYAKRPRRSNWFLAGVLIGCITAWVAGLYVGSIVL